jgi:hypothetical protein
MGSECTLVEGTIEADNICNLWEKPIAFMPSFESKKRAIAEGVTVIAESGEGGGAIWDVVLIREGKSKNRRRYKESVLRSAAPMFEGVKAFANHPSKEQRTSGDGRGVQEIVGWYEGVRYDEGVRAIVGQLHVLETAQWLRDLLKEQVAEGVELVGLSINAEGVQTPTRDGDDFLMEVESIDKVNSVDVVAEPAAGGAVVKLVASKEGNSMDELTELLKTMSVDKLKELRPDLYEQFMAAAKEEVGGGEGEGAAGGEGDPTPSAGDPDPAATPAPDPTPAANDEGTKEPVTAGAAPAAAPASAPATESITEGVKEPAADAAPTVLEEGAKMLEEIKRERATDMVSRKLTEAKLPAPLTESLTTEFNEALTRRILESDEVDARIKSARDLWGAMSQHSGSGRVSVPGSVREGGDQSGTDDLIKAIDGMLANEDIDGVPRLNSFKEAYYKWTGRDPFTTDPFTMFRESQSSYDSASDTRRLTESLTTGSWAEIFADRLFRRMVSEYRLPTLQDWQKIVSNRENITDFRTQRRQRWGGYGTLAGVSEGDTYPQLTSPGDEEATYAITKRGGLEDITFEMMVNDDLRNIRAIPGKLSRAAKQTLHRFVFDFIDGNAAVYDAVALIDSATHANHQTAALSAASLETAWQQMRAQAAFGNATEILATRPKYMLVPAELEQLAWQLVTSQVSILTSGFNATEPNFFQSKMEVIVVDYWTDANNWYMVADPSDIPTIEIGFLNGQEEPELFVQDQPNVGSVMTADKITYKVRHIYSGAVLDYRGFQGSLVA